ncbi:16S rRNA (adenine(1518)-N(6)/adenine(1519)-N(6))-dimethyltransferase RsmA [Putridiphycobacter roseus]
MYVKPKKHLGQHFLKDESVCVRMVEAIPEQKDMLPVLEVGPGTGALTKYLLKRKDLETHVIELDEESVVYLKKYYEALGDRIYAMDFLKIDLEKLMGKGSFIVAGNFPYNISSQILFKVLDYKDQIPFVVGMFQREVAQRIAEKPGTKQYGIISVLIQAYYDIDYLFTVNEDVFDPPPKVKSGVIQLTRNKVLKLDCNEKLFKQVVKTSFNQRRKTIRNSVKSMLHDAVDTSAEIFSERPEQLSVEEFIQLTNLLDVSN